MSFDATATDLALRCLAAFGEDVLITLPDSSTVEVRVVVDRKTRITTQLGDVLDARPSAQFPVSVMGNHPRGTFSALGSNWSIGRPVDGENDGYIVRSWLEPA